MPTCSAAATTSSAPASAARLASIDARRSARLQETIRSWLDALAFPRGVRVSIDIDPYSFV